MLDMIRNVMRNLAQRPATRINARAPFPAARGRVKIEIEKCIFCGMCQRRCPAGAIAVDRAAKRWTLDPFACIICGACVEACPKKCLRLDNAWRPGAAAKSAEVWQPEADPQPKAADN